MKKIILLLFVIAIIDLNAQGVLEVANSNRSITTHGQFYIHSTEIPILGSQYINETFKEGETLISGKSQTAALMRYDALNEAVELLDRSTQKPRKLLRRKNISATFDGKTYLVMDYMEGSKIKLGYFNQLNEGKVRLLYRPKKKFVQAENPDNGYDVYDPPTFKDVSQHYIKVGDKPASLLKLRKRSILKAINDKEAILKLFIKKHKLNLSKEADIILLLNYYNSLDNNSKATNSMGPIGIASLYIE